MQVEMRPINTITPYENNPRENDAGVDAVAASIQEFGFRQPIVVDEDGVIIVGHTRYKAALKLGWQEVPVHVAVGLNPAQAKAYRIADNQTATLSVWDDDKLPLELAQLQEMDFDLNLTGFSADELMRLLDSGGNAGQGDPDAVPEPPDEPITQTGDLWILGKHRLLCGDSSNPEDVDRLLDGATIHLVNTDPPYNVKVEPRSNNAIAAGLSSFQGTTHHQGLDVARHPEKSQPTTKKLRAKDRPLANDFVSDEEFESLLLAWFGNLSRVLLPGRAFYIWGGYANVANYPPALKATELYFSQTIIWDKQHPVLTRKDYMGAHEWCQPPDTQVLTPSGSSRLSALHDGDRVVSFYAHSSAVVGLRQGLGVRVAQRQYAGHLYGVTVGPRQSWSTDGHLWTIRLTRDYPQKWCVYLMRRGLWWRVGVTKMRTTWGFGLKGRLCSEQGDEGWILSLHDSHADARMHEQLVSVQFGIPQTCWKESRQAQRRQRSHIEDMYGRLDLERLDGAAETVLAAYHRRRSYPFVRNDDTRAKFGARQSIQVRACNLLPGIMEIPVPICGQQSQWEVVRAIDVQPYAGVVHSLGVAQHEHYIADGLVTHNCFYGWKEGAAHQFYGPNNATDLWAIKKVNPQNMIHLCLHPNAPVLTDAGFQKIRTISVGDRVFAGDGTFHRVEHVSTHPYTSEHLYRIVAKGGNIPVEASDNHPFLIWRPVKHHRRIVGGDVAWRRADELHAGDYTMSPILAESDTDPFPEMTEEDWFLFGLYLAQGHLQRAGHGERRYLAFSLHKRRQDLADRIWRRWPQAREYDPCDYASQPTSGTVVMAFDGDAGERFEALGGRLAHRKRLAPECFALPRGKRAAILHGWLNGDGCRVHDRKYWQGNTVSGDLAAQLCLLAESVGYRTNLYAYDPPADLGGIGDRRFKSRRRVYYLYFYEQGQLAKRGSPQRMEHQGRTYSLRPIKQVEPVKYSGEVWNLSVEGHPSFQTAVGLSHNTEKPVELAARAMEYSSLPGENILDLFGGSGSTLIAAEQTGRRAFLMELDPLYCDVIVQRYEQFTGQQAERLQP